jgi:hypothetical protein
MFGLLYKQPKLQRKVGFSPLRSSPARAGDGDDVESMRKEFIGSSGRLSTSLLLFSTFQKGILLAEKATMEVLVKLKL